MPSTFSKRYFLKRYRIALSIIALLAISAFSILQYIISSQSQYAQLINISGRQRMLSQKIVLHVEKFHRTKKPAEKQKAMELLKLFNDSHMKIISGKLSSELTYNLSTQSYQKYFGEEGLNDLIQSFNIRVEQALQSNSGISLDSEFIDLLLIKLNDAVLTFETESIQKTDLLRKIELGVLILTLFALLLEMKYIFRPLNETLEEVVNNLNIKAKEALEAKKVKSRFMTNMTHEIRTPLNGIIGSIELMDRETLSAENKRYVDTIASCSKTTLHLVNDILDFEKIEAKKLNLLNDWHPTSDIINDLELQFSNMAISKQLELVCKNKCDDFCIYADFNRLMQVISNIISNAIKFTHKGQVRLTLSLQDDQFVVLVSDDGVGMNEDEIKFIYEDFTQLYHSTENQLKGTGLGLSIAKRIVDLMQGKIEVQSKPKVGTTFILTLPFEFKKNKTNLKPDLSIVQNEKLASKNILILEDDKVNIMIISKYLEKLGHSYTIMENGELRLAEIKKNIYDIVLTDIQMPKMSGIDFYRLAK